MPEPAEITLKSTWIWSRLLGPVGIWAAVATVAWMAHEDGVHLAIYTSIFAVGTVAISFAELYFKVRVTDSGISVRALRTTFVPWNDVTSIDVRPSMIGKRLTVTRADGSALRLPVPLPSDPSWDEKVRTMESLKGRFGG